MTSWTDLSASGSGEVVYALEIPGWLVLTTYSWTPTDSWYTTAGYTAGMTKPWLKLAGLGPIQETVDFLEGSLEVDDIVVRINDDDGQLTALFKDHTARARTWLTAAASSTNTTFNVEATEAYPSSTATNSQIYIGQEVCDYGGKTATTFTGLTRALYGTTARGYTVDLTTEYGVSDRPVVTDGIHSLVGRRAILYGATVTNGTVGTTSVIYRGRIRKGIRVRNGEWEIPIEHISKVLDQKVGQNLPSSPLVQGYYMCGISFGAAGDAGGGWTRTIGYVDDGAGTFSLETDNEYIVPAEGWYSPEELAVEWSYGSLGGAGADDTTASVTFYLELDGDRWLLKASAATNRRAVIWVYKYDPLWCLGFAPGRYETDHSTAYVKQADDPPRLFCMHWGGASSGIQPTADVQDGSVFTAGLFAQVPGGPFGEIASISSNTITFVAGSNDTFYRTGDQSFWVVEDEDDDAILRHVIAIDSVDIITALQRCLYLDSGQSEPEMWCASGSLSADWDFTELTTALGAVPVSIRRWHDCISEGIEVKRLFGHYFGLLGIVPRIIAEGQIGFKRLETPTPTGADPVAVDSNMWSLMTAAQTEAKIGDTPLLNLVHVEHSRDYRTDSGGGGSAGNGWGPPIKITWTDGWNQLVQTRSIKYQLRGVFGNPTLGSFLSPRELGELLNQQIRPTHFGVFGRQGCTINLDVTWKGKQILCGDIVQVTHELVPDVLEGAIGMTSRLAVVVGRTQQLTENQPDQLYLMFGADANAAGIAPCAHGDAWNSGTLVMTFSQADTPLFEQSGANDLDRFVRPATCTVKLIKRNTTSATTWTATIDSGSVNTNSGIVRFESDPFTVTASWPSTNGVYMVLADWDTAESWQQSYAYIADNDATPALGAANDDPKEWGI